MLKEQKKAFNQQIAEWLQEIREEKGISQEALAIQLGKGQSDITKMENAQKKITVSDILSWMIALDIPVERLEKLLGSIYLLMKSNENSMS